MEETREDRKYRLHYERNQRYRARKKLEALQRRQQETLKNVEKPAADRLLCISTDSNKKMKSFNSRKIYLFVCTLPDCKDICLSRDKLLDHLEGHKVFETKIIDFDDNGNNGEEQLAEFVKMIDNGDNNVVISNTVNEPKMKTRNNSKKRCIFNNCKTTFVDREEAIDHIRKRHLTTLDTSKNNLLKIPTTNVDEIVDQPKSDSEHSDMAVDYLKIEVMSDADIDNDNNGFDTENDDQTLTPPEDSGKKIPKNKMVKPKSFSKKKKNEMVEPESLPKKRKYRYRYRDNDEQLFVWLSDDTNKKRPFKCLKCGKCYQYRNKVLKHNTIVHNQQRSYCQFEGCSASYSFPATLRHHVSIVHTKDAVLIRCPWPDCDYASYHQQLINKHSRVHTGERPYRCKWSDCQKAFKTPSALSLHTASHRNERQHRCSWPGCSYSCNISAGLRKHVELHERRRLKEESKVAMDTPLDSQDRPESSATSATALLKTLQ